MEVTVRSTVMVRPARSTPRRALWCSNLDQLTGQFYDHTLYFYRPPPTAGVRSPTTESDDDFFEEACKLMREALAEVLVPFYPVAGRTRLDRNGRLEIDCNGEGVVFVEADANVALQDDEYFADLGLEHDGPKYMKLVPQAAAAAVAGGDHDNNIISTATPLLLCQVTRFQCGGVCLGVAWDHILGGGISAQTFTNCWADAARGAPSVAPPPLLDRTVLAARDPPTPSFVHPEYEQVPPPTLSPADAPFVTSIFKLTRADINRLKRVTSSEAAARCGAYEAIVAHTWRCVCVARGLPAKQRTQLSMPVSMLHRLNPPLPPSYLGNSVHCTVCDATVGEVTAAPRHEIVGKVRAALARVDDDAYLRSVIDYIQLQPDLSKRMRGWNLNASPNLHVNSWVKLSIYDADFGWGRPTFVGPAYLHGEGMAVVLPRPVAADGLLVVVALHTKAMERFNGIFYDF